MARAPARLAPEIKVLLRRFGNCSLTSASPYNGPALLMEPGIQRKKFWAITLALDDGPNLSELRRYATISRFGTRFCRRLRRLG